MLQVCDNIVNIMSWHDNSGHECYVLLPLQKKKKIVTNAIRFNKQPVNFVFPPISTIQLATGDERGFCHDTILFFSS